MNTVKLAGQIGEWSGRVVAWGMSLIVIVFVFKGEHLLAGVWLIASFTIGILAQVTRILTLLQRTLPSQAEAPENTK